MGYLNAPAVKSLWRQSWVLLGQRQMGGAHRGVELSVVSGVWVWTW